MNTETADATISTGGSAVTKLEPARWAGAAVAALCAGPEIAGCREAWMTFQKHPNVEWEFFNLINRTRAEVEGACVLELKYNGATKSLWAGRIENGRLPLRLGYLPLGSIRVRKLHITTGGILGDDSEEACRVLLQRAMQVLVDQRLDLLVLSDIACNHPLFDLTTRAVPKWYSRDWGVVRSVHWRMKLPSTFEDFLKLRSKKHRYWLKRVPRVLEEAFPGGVKIRVFKEVAEVDEFCRDAAAVAQETYQQSLGAAFRADSEYQSRCRLLAENASLRGYVLYIKDKPGAYWFATAAGDTLHLNSTGYLPEFKKYELGTVLLMKLFADHCGTAMETVDFGLGGASYKERFGDESFPEATVRVYRSSLRSFTANFLIGCNTRISSVMKTLLSKLGLLQKVKTLWRSRLSS